MAPKHKLEDLDEHVVIVDQKKRKLKKTSPTIQIPKDSIIVDLTEDESSPEPVMSNADRDLAIDQETIDVTGDEVPKMDRVDAQPADGTEPKVPEDILPPELGHLKKKYKFANIAINHNSKIEKKVRQLFVHMSKFDFLDIKSQPGIVALDARSIDAGKLITVVELVKREVEKERSPKWYTYTRVSSCLTEIPRLKEGKNAGVIDVDVDEAAINSGTMKDTKLRAIPILTIYMARVPVPELREAFGEQSNLHLITADPTTGIQKLATQEHGKKNERQSGNMI